MTTNNKTIRRFYATFGTHKDYPYQSGYVAITADNIKHAERVFRSYYPDKTPGVLNCAFMYTAKEFESLRSSYSMCYRRTIENEALSVICKFDKLQYQYKQMVQWLHQTNRRLIQASQEELEEYYNQSVQLTMFGIIIKVPFCAETYNHTREVVIKNLIDEAGLTELDIAELMDMDKISM